MGYMMHIQSLDDDDHPRGPYVLVRHYHAQSAEKQGSCIGLPRKYGPPPEGLPEPDAAHQPHPEYIGVYLETVKPRRYYYKLEVGDRDIRGYGYTSPMKAAKAYDACITAFGLNLPGNFERDEEQAS